MQQVDSPGSTNWQFEVFYDGDCPLCDREMRALRRLDRGRQVCFTDIASEHFNPDDIGLKHDDLMAEIHGRLPDGTIVRGVDVFRHLYSAIGWKSLVSISRLPIISGMLDWSYGLFARNRLRLTGRCSTQECSV